jgi:hypothetical protein
MKNLLRVSRKITPASGPACRKAGDIAIAQDSAKKETLSSEEYNG